MSTYIETVQNNNSVVTNYNIINNYGLYSYILKIQDTGDTRNIMCCSSTGKNVYVITQSLELYFYYNNQYGVGGFKNTQQLNSMSSICCSSNGQYVYTFIVSKYIRISSNYGYSFQQNTNRLNFAYYYSCCSSNGQYIYGSRLLVQGLGGRICYNNNYGSGTWTEISSSSNVGLPNVDFGGITCSSDGKYVYVCSSNSSNICYNNNYGTGNWTTISSASNVGLPVGVELYNITTSSSGQYVYVSTVSSQILYNSNYGNGIWVTISTSLNRPYIVCTSNGNTIYAVGDSSFRDPVYIPLLKYTQLNSDIGQIFAPITDVYGPVATNYDVLKNNKFSTPTPPNGTMVSWKCITTSSSGQYVYLPSYNTSNISISTNYGVSGSWRISTLPTTDYRGYGIATSSSGQYIYICDTNYGNIIYVSNYYGLDNSWTTPTLPFASNWLAITTSSSGKYVYLSSSNNNNDKICISTNYGMNDSWTISTLPNTGNWSGIATSSSGQYVYICNALNTDQMCVSTNYGVSWSTSTLPNTGSWSGIATSSSGQYVYICNSDNTNIMCVSTNYGVSWSTSTLPNTGNWSGITTSSSGQYVYICGIGINNKVYVYTQTMDIGKIFATITDDAAPITTNYIINGNNKWIKSITSPVPTVAKWSSIASSSSGQYLAACINNIVTTDPNTGIWVSNNFGSSWVKSNASSGNWASITSSASGQNLAACIVGGSIYLSVDFGSTWTQATTSLPTVANWSSIASSSSGLFLAACSAAGAGIYVSNNSGFTWTQSKTDSNWTSITSSTSGMYIVACNTSSGVWISRDYGYTWSQSNNLLINTKYIVASSASGNFLSVCGFNDAIYTYSQNMDIGSMFSVMP